MAQSNGRLHLSPLSLLLILFPAIAFGALMKAVIDLSRSAHDRDSEHLKVTTDLMTSTLETYLEKEAAAAAALTRVPRVVEDVRKLGARPYNKEQVRKLDDAWRADEEVDDLILESDLSKFLQSFTGSPDSPYRELLIADAQGRLIAASNRTEDYDQVDDSWWPAQSRAGQDKFDMQCGISPLQCTSLADVAFDPSADATAFALVVPIVGNNRVHGVLKAVVDTSTLKTLMDLVYSTGVLKGRLLGNDGHDVLEPSFSTPAEIRGAITGLAAGQEWDSGDEHLRRTESRFQTRPWTIYVQKHAYGVSPSSSRGALLLVFATLMVLITAFGMALAIGRGFPRKAPESV